MNKDRSKSYEIVGNFLNEKGAPSNIWSHLEKLLEPNGIFLKQRNEISKLKDENEKLWSIIYQADQVKEQLKLDRIIKNEKKQKEEGLK